MVRSLVLCSAAALARGAVDPTGLSRAVSSTLDALVTERNLAPSPSPESKTLTVKMSDGVGLRTKYSLPYPYDEKRCAVLEMSPYGFDVVSKQFEALNGCASVFQQDRGTFLSGGTFDVWRGQAQDAHETIDWIVSQPWSNGEVFTVGVSAIGISEVLLALAPHAHLKGQWLAWSPSNGHSFGYPGGAYRKDLTEGYMDFMSLPTRGASKNKVVPEVKAHEGWDADYWGSVTVCRNASTPESEFCHYSTLVWPMVDSAGWWDLFGSQQVDAFQDRRQLSDESVRDKHVLIVDPLGHCSLAGGQLPGLMAANSLSMSVGAALASEIFAGNFDGPVRSRLGRVNLFVMRDFAGNTTGSYWTSLEEFPSSEGSTLFLDADQQLTADLPSAAARVDYVYDPTDPTPMLGGDNLPGVGAIKQCGSVDQTPREGRSDVVLFDSDVLAADVAVVGKIRAKLFVSSNATETDFVVIVSDLSEQASMSVSHGVKRMRWRHGDEAQAPAMEAGEVYEITVELDNTAYIFAKGHRIRVSVASAAAPFYNANSNTGVFEDTVVVSAANTVHFAPEYPSQLWIPVVAMDDLPENQNFGGLGETLAV